MCVYSRMLMGSILSLLKEMACILSVLQSSISHQLWQLRFLQGNKLISNILLLHKWNHTFLYFALTIVWACLLLCFLEIFTRKQTQCSNNKTIVIELSYWKNNDLSISHRSIICLSLIRWDATGKSQYVAQPCPIIVKH